MDAINAKIRESRIFTTGAASTVLGVAEVNFALSEGTDSLIDRADVALYKAKAAGRNCVVASEKQGD